jgi:hypothetical protein
VAAALAAQDLVDGDIGDMVALMSKVQFRLFCLVRQCHSRLYHCQLLYRFLSLSHHSLLCLSASLKLVFILAAVKFLVCTLEYATIFREACIFYFSRSL